MHYTNRRLLYLLPTEGLHSLLVCALAIFLLTNNRVFVCVYIHTYIHKSFLYSAYKSDRVTISVVTVTETAAET